MIIGLTGVSGAGKTTVSEFFAANGFFVINCDRFVHEKVYRDPDVLELIKREFGPDTVKDGKLDRIALRGKVFGDKAETERLNRLILPIVKEKMNPVLEEHRDRNILLDAPTLFQSGIDRICDLTVAVLAEEAVLFRRISARDGLSAADIRDRLKSQYDAAFFEKNCNYVIYNNGTLAELKEQASRIITIINEKTI